MADTELSQDWQHVGSFGQLVENVGVICVLTANVPVVYIEKNSINHEENKAWAERFGANVLHFNCKLPNPDKRFKTWGKQLGLLAWIICRCFLGVCVVSDKS